MAITKPWSIRFVLAAGAVGYYSYTVPAGKRAVVRNIAVGFGGTTGGAGYLLQIAGRNLSVWSAPGSNVDRFVETRAVAYEGEQIRVYLYTDACIVFVSGYLLDGGGVSFLEEGEREVDLTSPPPDSAFLELE